MTDPHPTDKIGKIERELRVPADVAEQAARAVTIDDSIESFSEYLTNYTDAQERIVIEGEADAPLIAGALGDADGTVRIETPDPADE